MPFLLWQEAALLMRTDFNPTAVVYYMQPTGKRFIDYTPFVVKLTNPDLTNNKKYAMIIVSLSGRHLALGRDLP
jgi:hypothetical protein